MFFKGHARPLSLRGDTIVEVLLAISILSVVLAGAFASASQSQVNNRASQERVEALKLSQGHVEVLRYIASSGNEEIFDASAGLFCIDSSLNIVRFGSNSLPALDSDDFNSYPGVCKNINTRYNLSIRYDEPSNIFITTARWVRFGGISNEEAALRYRVHQGSLVASPTEPTTCSQNKNIALLLDRSTSMNKNMASSETPKWEALKNAATLFVEQTDFSPTANKGAVIGFYKEAEELISMTSDKTQLLDFMNSLGPAEYGGTDYYKGLAAVNDEFEESDSFSAERETVVVMLTDGGHNIDSDPLIVATELKAKGAIIYTIGVFDDIWFTPEYQKLLEDISGNGGYFVNSTNETELVTAFQEIAELLGCDDPPSP